MGIYGVKRYITRRQHHLLTPRHAQSLQATTILVCGIPIHDGTFQSLHSIFSVFPGGVKHIWPAYSAADLQKDVLKRISLTDKLESATCALIRSKLKHQTAEGADARRRQSGASSTDMLHHQQAAAAGGDPFPPEKRPQHRPAVFPMTLFASCCGAKKVDSVSTYRNEIAGLNNSIVTRQQAGIAAINENEDENRIGAAFIQFNSQLGAHLAAQAVIHRKILIMQPRHLEVHPKDVVWGNLSLSLEMRNIRRTIASALAVLLITFWTIPVAFVASISKLDAIVSYAPFLSGVYSLPKSVVGIIQGILPPIFLTLLMMVPPIILYSKSASCSVILFFFLLWTYPDVVTNDSELLVFIVELAHFGGEVLTSRKTLSVITYVHWFSVRSSHSSSHMPIVRQKVMHSLSYLTLFLFLTFLTL